MLREFQIDSDDLAYSGGVAPVVFSKKPTTRIAIVAITAKGVQLYAHQNLLGSLKIDGREYVAGDAFPLALISNQPMPAEDNSTGTPSDKLASTLIFDDTAGTPESEGTLADVTATPTQALINNNFATVSAAIVAMRNNIATLAACGCATHAPQYFPGTGLIMNDGQRVGVIPVGPRQSISMSLTDLTTGSAELTNITLHCVELPDDCHAGHKTTEALWKRLTRGVGVISFHGLKVSAFTDAMTSSLEYTPETHGAQMARQVEVRGSLTEDVGSRPKESDMQLVSAEIKTSSESSPTDGAVNARSIIGTAAAPIKDAAMVDLLKDEVATVKVSSPAPTDGLARTLRLVAIHEGREAIEKQNKLATAPN